MKKIVPILAILISFGFVQIANAQNSINFKYSPALEKKFTDEYGIREKAELEEELSKDLMAQFADKNVKIEILIEDVIPNRPTMGQLSAKPGLSMQSFGNGGAQLSGKVFDTNNIEIAKAEYKYYGFDIREARYYWTWHDAEYAMEKFAKKLASN